MGIISVVGCELSGPPPAVGGRERVLGRDRRTLSTGETGGESGGAGMFVPDVREKSTGRTDNGCKVYDLRLSAGFSGIISAVLPKDIAADRLQASNLLPVAALGTIATAVALRAVVHTRAVVKLSGGVCRGCSDQRVG